jgi:HD-like signal output (HDOD) protein
VVDSAAAAFQMVANGHPDCINPLMDLVARDPGLTVQMLVAANRAHPPAEDFNRIEDARLAIGQLGELRLLDEARRLVQVDERVFDLGGGFAWPRFWAFQRGVARIAQHICRELEFDSLEPAARTAGQIHDLGLLLLARVRPGGFQALLAAQRRGETHPRAVERRLLGCTTPELGARFAETHGLSPRFVRVLRGRDDPAAAGEDRHLAAIVSLARHLCRHNRVGDPGEPPPGQAAPLEETPEWAVLREGLYPSFNFRRFELRIHAQCTQLESDLRGRDAGTVAETVAGAET